MVGFGQKVYYRRWRSHLVWPWVTQTFGGMIPRSTLDVHTIHQHTVSGVAFSILGGKENVRKERNSIFVQYNPG